MNRNSTGVRDQDTGATLRALRRAARHALKLGVRTGTPVYVIRDHRIVDLTKSDRVVVRKPPKRSTTRLP